MADPSTQGIRNGLAGSWKVLGSQPLESHQTEPSLSCSNSPQKAALPGPMPSELLLVLLYVLLGNWPVFAYLPPLGHFTTLSNRPHSLSLVHIWFRFSLSEPLCKESLHFPQWSPARTPRTLAASGPWSLTRPPGISALNLLLGFSTVYTFISPKRRNFGKKKAREGSRTVRTESKLREDANSALVSPTELASLRTQRDRYGAMSGFPQTQAFLPRPPSIKRGLEPTLGRRNSPSAYT